MTELQSLLRTLGITANLRGFRYLKRATELAIEDPDCLLNIGKLIYNTVAQEFETTPKCVERNIRTAIDSCWLHGNRKLLCQIAGYELQEKPTNSQFIDIISAYLISIQSPTVWPNKAHHNFLKETIKNIYLILCYKTTKNWFHSFSKNRSKISFLFLEL